MPDNLLIYVNGKRMDFTESNPVPPQSTTLLEFLRSRGFTGTKLGCGEGGCGACTVLVSDSLEGKQRTRTVNACLVPLYTADGCNVTTVEGIGSTQKMHEVQERLASMHASQCGFCTPGFVVSLYGMLQNNSNISQADIEEGLDGNLCRCTGYRAILDAAKSLATGSKEDTHSEPIPEDTTGSWSSQKTGATSKTTFPSVGNLSPGSNSIKNPCCGTQLAAELKATKSGFNYKWNSGEQWYTPCSLAELVELKGNNPEAKLVAGNSELGIDVTFKGARLGTLLSTARVPELRKMDYDKAKSVLTIGAAVTLTEIMDECAKLEKTLSKGQSRGLNRLRNMLRWFAGQQIRNVATLAGNVCTASPISDTVPLLRVMGADIKVTSSKGSRVVNIVNFIKGYRRVELQPEEVVEAIHIPIPSSESANFEFVSAFKQCKRREDDISIVTTAFRVLLTPDEKEGAWIIKDIKMAFGGMNRLTVSADHAVKALTGKKWDLSMLDEAYGALEKDLPLPKVVPGGMPEYRKTLSLSMFYKFFVSTTKQLQEAASALKSAPPVPKIAEEELSAAESYLDQDHKTTVSYQEYPKNIETRGLLTTQYEEIADNKRTQVGQPLVHNFTHLQVTGEAKYGDDYLVRKGDALSIALVLSSKAHAKILSVDTSGAAKLAGVRGVFTYKDIPGVNTWGLGGEGGPEPALCEEEVKSVGHTIAVVCAETQKIAEEGVRLVKVEYEELPAILTVEEGIKAKSFFGEGLNCYYHKDNKVESISADYEASEIKWEGVARMGGQEHFYLEPQNCIIEPGEDGEVLAHVCTQDLVACQKTLCSVLGVPQHKVTVKTKRLGGGFGGKETRTHIYTLSAAIAAYHLQQPVKFTVRRDIDMSTSGGRHPHLTHYKVGCTKDGTISSVTMDSYINAGYSLDLSGAVLTREVSGLAGPYHWPSVLAMGHVVYTNTVSNTAFRGFGSPQGMYVAECIVDDVARTVGVAPEIIRERHLCRKGEMMIFNQALDEDSCFSMWTKMKDRTQFWKRREEFEKFNASHKWKKKGICLLPTRFAIGFGIKCLNQGTSLVHIYTDGSVQVTHGGVEMGQGLSTKVAQIAANSLKIPMSSVFIANTSTEKCANNPATAASCGSDLFGMATLDACEQLNKRLAPIREQLGADASDFSKVALTAWLNQVNLSAAGHWKNPDIIYDWENPNQQERGRLGQYFTCGVACTEISLDVLTGDTTIDRVDIMMDLGQSINPAIDIGQIEGAFAQGVGLFTMEEVVWGDQGHQWIPQGAMHTKGPGTYKIPSCNDTPLDWRIYLAHDSDNIRAIHSSRAIGEPPLFLGASVLFAIKEAIASVRSDNGLTGRFELNSPATPERIRMACGDAISKRFLPSAESIKEDFQQSNKGEDLSNTTQENDITVGGNHTATNNTIKYLRNEEVYTWRPSLSH